MSAYSFLNIVAAMVGPGVASINLGVGAAVAEEGITIAPSEDKNTMIIGADGRGQHTLIASNGGLVTLRYLKTSPVNGLLQLAYDLQSASSALWGQNVFTVVDTARLELTTAQSCAFKKKPEIVYDKAGPMLEWTFDSQAINSVLSLVG
jgi:structural protein KPP10_ORF10